MKKAASGAFGGERSKRRVKGDATKAQQDFLLCLLLLYLRDCCSQGAGDSKAAMLRLN